VLRKQIKRVRKAQADFDAKMAAEFPELEDILFEHPTIVFCGDRCLWSDIPSSSFTSVVENKISHFICKIAFSL
jgi:hypothetical protein